MKTLSSLYNEKTFLTIYGEPYGGPKDPIAFNAADGASVKLVEVVGFRVFGRCEKLPLPAPIFLPGEGTEVDDSGSDCGWKKPVRKWTLDPGYRTSGLTIYADTITRLLEGPIHPEGVSGGVSVGNWRWQGGGICCTVHVWAKAEICVFGGCHTILDMNETRDVCVNLSQCLTFLDIGVANAQICFYAPKQVCVDVNINVGPFHQRVVHQCVDIPIPHTAASEEEPCGCKEKALNAS